MFYFQNKENLLEEGSGSHIYTLSTTEIIKVAIPGLHPSITWEYDVTKALFQEGISVPEPYAIEDVSIQGIGQTRGIRMQRLYGINSGRASETVQPQLKELLKQELQKCIGLGFIPVDADLWNTMYDHHKDRLYLIDFEWWERTR